MTVTPPWFGPLESARRLRHGGSSSRRAPKGYATADRSSGKLGKPEPRWFKLLANSESPNRGGSSSWQTRKARTAVVRPSGRFGSPEPRRFALLADSDHPIRDGSAFWQIRITRWGGGEQGLLLNGPDYRSSGWRLAALLKRPQLGFELPRFFAHRLDALVSGPIVGHPTGSSTVRRLRARRRPAATHGSRSPARRRCAGVR